MNNILKENQLKKTDIFKLCSTFDKKEADKCAVFLAEFTTASKRCRMLYDEIYKYYKKAKYDWEKVDIEISIINKKLIGTNKENNSSRVLRSELYKNLKKYSIFLNLQNKQEGNDNVMFLDYLSTRKADYLFFKEYTKIDKNLENKVGTEYTYLQYRSNKFYLELILKDQSKKNKLDYNLHYEKFSNYSIIQKIQNYCFALNHQLIKNLKINPKIEQEVKLLFEQAKQIPEIKKTVEIYETASLMLNNDKLQYIKLKNILSNIKENNISKKDKKYLYVFMHNFCIRNNDLNLKGETRINRLAQFDEGLLHEGEFISVMNAKVLCTTVLALTRSLDESSRMNKVKAEEKIKEITKELPLKHRESTEYFHLAVLDYYFEDYEKTIEKLKDSPKYPNAFFDFDARVTLQRCYYFTENIDEFGNGIKSFQAALRNDRDLSEKHKKEYLNFTRAISILQKANNVIDKMEKEKLLQKLEKFLQEHPVKVLAWFKGQIELLR